MVENSENEPQLRPANESPWYCLATLYGEQDDEYVDDKLAEKNKIAWNLWIAAARNEISLRDSNVVATVAGYDEKKFLCAFRSRMANETAALPKVGEAIDFSGLRFDRRVDFSGYIFPWPVTFDCSTFSSYADFESAMFSSRVDFGSVRFLSGGYFRSATFSSIAVFESATFASAVIFISATFAAHTDFNSVIFSDYTDFSSASFSTSVDFETASFSDDADFSSANFTSEAEFNFVIFSKEPSFIGARFGGRTSFIGAIFKSNVPDFRGASLHEATEWDDAHWPDPPSDLRWPFMASDKRSARQQVYAYQRLKLEMEKLKKHEDELVFFRKELRSRRGTFRVLSPNWCLNLLYEATSNFGQSIGRPLFWLVVFYVSAAVFFAKVDLIVGKPLSWPNAWGLSFANIFPFLSLRKDFLDPKLTAKFSHAVLYVSAAESILAATLLFLFGLGLRNRFRIK